MVTKVRPYRESKTSGGIWGGGEASGQWPENSAHIPVLPVSGWMTLAPRPPVFLDCNLIFSHVGRGRAWTMGLSVLLLR